jgi:hypothetical protein
MLFCVTWEFIDTSEAGTRRSLGVFQQRFTVKPVLPIESSAAIAGEAVGFRDSVA